ncbi:MAG: flavodoxin family protein [Planctomycetes bacterium]|nr:flavodoxin family protein [Planctomycetota bacterium]
MQLMAAGNSVNQPEGHEGLRAVAFAAGLTTVLLVASGLLDRSACHAAQGTPAPRRKHKPVHVLVAYYTRTGNTEQMARAVVEGVKRVPGAVVVLKRVEQVTKEDLQQADAIILGAPTYFANIPAVMKEAIDRWNWKWKVDLTDKVGGAFATGGGQMGGKEHVAVSLLLFLLNNRMIVAGPLFEDPEGDDKWGEIAAGAMTGPIDPGVGPAERDSGRRLGERIARVAAQFRRP